MRDPQKRSHKSINIYWVSKNEISYEKKRLIFIFVDKVIVPFGKQTRSYTQALGRLFGNKLAEVSKNQKDSEWLNPQSSHLGVRL